MNEITLKPAYCTLSKAIKEESYPGIPEEVDTIKIPVIPATKRISIGGIFLIEKINGPVKFISQEEEAYTPLPKAKQYPNAAIIIDEIGNNLGPNHIETDKTGRFIVLIRKVPSSWRQRKQERDPHIFIKVSQTVDNPDNPDDPDNTTYEFFSNGYETVVVQHAPNGWVRVSKPNTWFNELSTNPSRKRLARIDTMLQEGKE